MVARSLSGGAELAQSPAMVALSAPLFREEDNIVESQTCGLKVIGLTITSEGLFSSNFHMTCVP